MTRLPAIPTVTVAHRGIDELHKLAKLLVPTGFLPSSIKTPEQALAVMLKAQELSIPPMYGLSNISVIDGKPTCSAELMLALIYRDHGGDAIAIERTDNDACSIVYRRGSLSAAKRYTFSLDAARHAGLLSRQSWQKYPAAMLRARCISAVARMAFPDSIAGMYTPEEIGAIVTLTPDGESIIDTELPSSSVRRTFVVAQDGQSPAETDTDTQPDETDDGVPFEDEAAPGALSPARTAADDLYARMRRLNPQTMIEAPGPDATDADLSTFVDTWLSRVQVEEQKRAATTQRRAPH